MIIIKYVKNNMQQRGENGLLRTLPTVCFLLITHLFSSYY